MIGHHFCFARWVLCIDGGGTRGIVPLNSTFGFVQELGSRFNFLERQRIFRTRLVRTQALSLAAVRVWVVATFPTTACRHAATAAAVVVIPVFHLGHAFGERGSVFRVLRSFI